jgi:replicative superfamily II helicase
VGSAVAEAYMDFDKFADGGADLDPTDPIALYDSLDPQTTHVDLRPAQIQILRSWSERRKQRDIVIKLATGAGKTTVGLVALYSHMLETQRPCMFLCPTNQLVGQVIHESKRCGVPAVEVLGGQDIPPEALSGAALVVTSVQSIFQARAGRSSRQISTPFS